MLTMSHASDQVRKFYEVVWNNHDKTAIPDVLHASFSFRGSLGTETLGHAGFAEYLDMVHGALGDYRCIVKEMVAEQTKVFAKLEFTGIHRGVFMGVKPTGRRLTWDGAALFHFKGGKASSLWVLGDLKSLESQLHEDAPR
jgi:predicted ester cyclase